MQDILQKALYNIINIRISNMTKLYVDDVNTVKFLIIDNYPYNIINIFETIEKDIIYCELNKLIKLQKYDYVVDISYNIYTNYIDFTFIYINKLKK